jgi:hypothetical protein
VGFRATRSRCRSCARSISARSRGWTAGAWTASNCAPEAASAGRSAWRGQSELALEQYWIEQALLGGNLPPRELPDTPEMIEAVARAEAAIGYVPLGRLGPDSSLRVRTLRLIRGSESWLPTEPGYPVRVP